MRKQSLGWLVLVGALFAGGACGRSASSTGSNTNWLERCDMDSDCGSGSECWCGACTKSCTATDECESGAECTTTASHGCGAPSASGAKLCVQPCAVDDDCAGEGSGYSCSNGACLPAPAIGEVGGAGGSSGGTSIGSAGTTDSGGSAGTTSGGSGGAGGGASFPRGSYGISGSHACVVHEGQVYCWGANLFGQVGTTPAFSVDQPTLVAGLPEVASIALSPDHTCALTTAGDVYCWGHDDSGQIGGPRAPEETCPDYVLDKPGHYPCQPTPTRVEQVSNALEVAVSMGRSCALLDTGFVSCWGDVEALSDTISRENQAVGIEMGWDGACLITPMGYDCDVSLEYQPGLPYELDGIRLSGTATSAGFICFIDKNPLHMSEPSGVKAVVCTGANDLGQLGLGVRDVLGTGSPALLGEIGDVALGDAHACALTIDGKVRCWGKNSSGQVGPVPLASPPCGYETCETGPLEVVGLPAMQSIAAGGDRSCGFAVDGTFWCWGADSTGYGPPIRVPGPWEEQGDTCGDLLGQAARARKDAIFYADHNCAVDSDCTMLPMDQACDVNCAWLSLSKGSAESTAAALAQIGDDYCPQALAAGCRLSDLSCPEPTTRAVCVDSVCTLDDPEHSGCTDHCACAAVRYSQFSIWQDECAGFDLWPAIGLECPACEDSALYVVVTNRGDTRFEGDAVVSFEQQADTDFSAAELPGPVTVSLALDPGQVSEAIRVSSKAPGVVNMRVSADGDCNPLDDVSQVMLPSPTNACE